MKRPQKFDAAMLAPCGVNCAVCYRHISPRKHGVACGGCLAGDDGKPERCRMCAIKACARGKGLLRCHDCGDFPCRRIRNFDKSYRKRYRVSVVANGVAAGEEGIEAFMSKELEKWTCRHCGGLVSQHDGTCSECGGAHCVESP